MRTASGDIRTRSVVVSEVNASTVSGDLSLDLAQMPESGFELRSISGELRLSMPEDARFRADVHTVSGTIKSGFRREQVDFRSTHKRETVLDVNGGGVTVHLQSVSGDIYIHARRGDDAERADDFGWREKPHRQHAGHHEAPGAATMDLSRNPEYARVAPAAPAEPSPERRAAELEILQMVQAGELTPQEAVQRLAALDGEVGAPAVPADHVEAPHVEAHAEPGAEEAPATEIATTEEEARGEA
jgi:hypothetical protein